MRLGLVTYNVAKDWDVDTIIANLEKVGYEAVELRTTHAHKVEPSLTQAERQAVRERFAASKVRLLSLGTANEFHAADAAVRRENVAEAKQFLELAHDLGCLGIKVRPNGLPKDVDEDVTLRRIGEALEELGEFGANVGVEVWVECHGRDTAEPERMAKIMDYAGHEMVGACWNCNSQDVRNGSVAWSFELLKDKIYNVHLKELWDYPSRELFRLLQRERYERYLLVETQSSCEWERYLRYYQALYEEMTRV